MTIPYSSISDAELEQLLTTVYVEGGFTAPELAATMFAAAAVRSRGQMLVKRDPETQHLLGIVIVVPPTSTARHLAAAEEPEMHLLAVDPAHRGQGAGRSLIDAAMTVAQIEGYERMVLWTQPTMHAAQRLYEAAGFKRQPVRDFQHKDRAFLVFEAEL